MEKAAGACGVDTRRRHQSHSGFGDVPKKGASPRRGRDTSEGVAQGQVDEIVVRVFAEDGVLPACPEHDAVDAFQ